MAVSAELSARVTAWIADDPDESTAAAAQSLLNRADAGDISAEQELAQCFGEFLQFGTAGLRGPLGPGPSCMNRAVVIRAARGLVNYMLTQGSSKIVVGYDARHRSVDFALDTVSIAAAAGLEAVLLPRALPTPVLAYAVRALGADAGVMVTASHNPAKDNGYKVYLGDGSQIIPPQDGEIAAEIALVTSALDVPMSDEWVSADESLVDDYIASCVRVLAADAPRNIRIAYTPLHGVGYETLAKVLESASMGQLDVVEAQAEPDPDFPTVAFPNPEEAGATDLLLALAHDIDADIAIANDPDADRCAMAAKDHDGEWRLLRGDEVGALLGWWTISRSGEFGLPAPRGTLAASIVSATLLEKMALRNGFKYQSTLTGFKWIAKIPDLTFGYEEALGYCVDAASVRDKDGISAALRLAELAAWLKSQNRTVAQLLDDIAREYGLHVTDQLSVRMNNLADIPAAVNRLRSNPPSTLAGRDVTLAFDLKNGFNGLPPTDGYLLSFEGGRVIVRPSGTEPKLKCYLEVIVDNDDIAAARDIAAATVAQLKTEMKAVLGV